MTAEIYIRQELSRFLKSKNISDIAIQFEVPRMKKFGDLSCNIAMQLAGILKRPPRPIAEEIRTFIVPDRKYIEKIDIAGPGFLNFYITESSIQSQLLQILKERQDYGRSDTGKGIKTQVEFVSANPTGPLTIGHGRQAVLGDTIARILEFLGYEVTREYYYNNAGRQMRILGDSVRLRYLQLLGDQISFPDDYYQGDYIVDVAREILNDEGEARRNEKQLDYFIGKAERAVFQDIRQTIERLGFSMDVYYNERTLYDDGMIDEVLAGLRAKNLVEERDGAVWFLTSKIGMEQDRVVVKSSGEPTYRLPDIAYHREKFRRGFDLIIDIFGADHIATYPDVLLGLKALGYDPDRVKVLIHQFVTLSEGSQKVRMSTRKANFVTLDELMDEVGVDVTRFFFLMRHMNSHLNFDLSLAKTQSDENPVFYIQYAHARICSILSFGAEKGVEPDETADLSVLNEPESLDLIKHLLQFPASIANCGASYEPHRLVNYLTEAATCFHKFYTEHRVITDDRALTQARLALCLATRIILATGCQLLGIAAPEKM